MGKLIPHGALDSYEGFSNVTMLGHCWYSHGVAKLLMLEIASNDNGDVVHSEPKLVEWEVDEPFDTVTTEITESTVFPMGGERQ